MLSKGSSLIAHRSLHFFALAIHQNQVPRVGNDIHDIPEHAHRVTAMREVDQQNDRAGDRLPPENDGNLRLLMPLTVQPLNQKTGEETNIPAKTEYQPAQRDSLAILADKVYPRVGQQQLGHGSDSYIVIGLMSRGMH